MIERLLMTAALPYTRRELPGWGGLLRRAGVLVPADDPRWREPCIRIVKGKDHGLLMRLDLSDWAQRMTFCLGRYYESGVLQVLDRLLRPGDTFVDVGANIGMIALHASARVGSSGAVHCFEPNPECLGLLREHIALNGLRNVRVHPFALSDEPGELELRLTSEHTGTATLAQVACATRTFAVPVRVGDEALAGISPRVVKIDVEGFEVFVLRGLADTLRLAKPFVVTEVEDTLLRRAGTTPNELMALMSSFGYRAFGIRLTRSMLRWHLALPALRTHRQFGGFSDILWVPDGRRVPG
ncbi:MAG TPA: FkbM family methyltransferase [Ramlibacter sp.]